MTALQDLNDRLESDLDEPLRMGIGLHTGSVILGDMGYGPSRGLTAIGDVDGDGRIDIFVSAVGSNRLLMNGFEALAKKLDLGEPSLN